MHGRVEERALLAFLVDGMAMDFPHARSAVMVRSERTEKRTGRTTEQTHHDVCSVGPGERSSEAWHGIVRGHWAGVDNRNHRRRDAKLGEDRSRGRNTGLLSNLALLRNTSLRVLSRSFPGESVPVIKERLQSSRTLALHAAAS